MRFPCGIETQVGSACGNPEGVREPLSIPARAEDDGRCAAALREIVAELA